MCSHTGAVTPRIVARAGALCLVIGLATGCQGSTGRVPTPQPASPVVTAVPVATLPTLDVTTLGKTMVPLTLGHGNAFLPAFTATGESLFVELACIGSPGGMSIGAITAIKSCDGGAVLNELAGYKGHRFALTVSATADTSWELFIASGPASPAP